MKQINWSRLVKTVFGELLLQYGFKWMEGLPDPYSFLKEASGGGTLFTWAQKKEVTVVFLLDKVESQMRVEFFSSHGELLIDLDILAFFFTKTIVDDSKIAPALPERDFSDPEELLYLSKLRHKKLLMEKFAADILSGKFDKIESIRGAAMQGIRKELGIGD